MYIYENSILFKNEMIHFQLPDLHKFISFFERSMGIEEAVKRINDLYWFPFQEKQVQKAIIKLGKDKKTAHQYVHFLLTENNLPLVKTLSKVSHLAELYLLLFDDLEETRGKKEDTQQLLLTLNKGFFSQKTSERKQEGVPEVFNERIYFVCKEMIKVEDYRFNHEITKTLEAAHKFLTAEHLKDFYEASSILEELNGFPVEIKYLKDIQNLVPQIKKIKDRIESIERFEIRHSLLNEQKQSAESLSKAAEQTFYQPFANIWKSSLDHLAKLIEMEINIQQGLNPYIAGHALKGTVPLFYGRDDAYNFIDKNIITSGGHHTIVCHGFRRTGKSSLLYRIASQGFTNKSLVPVYFDMQRVDDEKHFYYSLSNSIVQGMSLQSTFDIENFSEFKKFVKNLKTELPEKKIVLLIDEFEELETRVKENKISENVFSNIRHLMQHEEKLIFLLCGRHKLEEMNADYWSIFFNTAIKYYKVSFFNPNDTEKLIREPVKDQLTYDDLAVEKIIKMTNGQPFLTQLMCHTIVDDLNENKKRNYITTDDVDEAVEKIIIHEQDHFSSHIWQESNTLERLILSTAAEEMEHKQQNNVGLDVIYDKIGTVTTTFSKKECMETLAKLVSKDILTEKNLCYSFPVNMFRKWVFVRHPLWQVREEI
ncbi:MAG: AAA family ATPase [Desulfobacteraceae bacterium]|nr:AAA family ATPase [Desulfobacteraceae bacterium]